MKHNWKRKKQLERVKKWLKSARPELEERARQSWCPEFKLLIAIEQLVIYLEMEERESKRKADSV